jgi:signal transduction histidine kinase
MVRSLRFRLIVSTCVIVLVTLGAAGLALFARMGSYRDEVTAGTLRQVAAPIYYNLTLINPATLTQGEASGRRLRAELTDYLALQREDTGVIVLLLDASGHPIPDGTSDQSLASETFDVPPPAPRGPNFDDLTEGHHTTASGDELQYVIVPTPRYIRAQDAGISAFVIALPDTSRRDVWADLTPRLIFAGLVGLAAAALTMVALWASLFRTLPRVTAGVRAVAAGDYGQRVPESGPTEMRELARDVNRMADSVEASQRTLREFLANVSHELKTPLTSIRGFSQAMLDGTMQSQEERDRAARVIDAESRRVLHLVGELLDLSRIQSGQARMALGDVAITDLLRHMRDVFALRSEQDGVALEVKGPDESVVARADFDRIEQVLGNLLDNAFQHTPRGGAIELGAVMADDGTVEVYVQDNGAGIPPADVPHVFDRFYRSGVTADQAGSGLGLAISQEIVRAHGGEVTAANRTGGGARFAFTLHAVRVASGDLPATDATTDQQRRQRSARLNLIRRRRLR